MDTFLFSAKVIDSIPRRIFHCRIFLAEIIICQSATSRAFPPTDGTQRSGRFNTSASGRVSRVPRQSRRSAQIAFNRPPADVGRRTLAQRRWYESAGAYCYHCYLNIAAGNGGAAYRPTYVTVAEGDRSRCVRWYHARVASRRISKRSFYVEMVKNRP